MDLDTDPAPTGPVAPAIAAAPRWAQLTYASFDHGDGMGGWQVKETRGDLDPVETAAITAQVVTSFDSHDPLPEYPTPADIAQQPRRFVYLPTRHARPDGAPGPLVGQYVHAVQAGSDSTGRPGNVFTHAVLDRRPGDPEPPVRPIDLWRSFDLLTPYGAEQVLGATLAEADRPRDAGMVGLDMVADFLFDPAAWRIGVLSVLLDALDEAMRGGRRVLLATSSADQAALWIAAASRLMSPGTARALSWSVYERAGRLASAWERGTQLAAVPANDLGELTDDDLARWIVVREDETPALGQPGHSPHRTEAGSEVRPTPWSELAQDVLLDRETAARALAEIDAVSASAGDVGLHPFWPLAMTVLRLGGGGEGSLARAVALDLVPPDALRDASVVDTLRREVVRGAGTSAADARAALDGLDPGAPAFVRDALAAEALARSFADADAVAAADDAAVPVIDASSPLAAPVGDAVAARLAETGDDAAATLRTADLALRAGLLDEPDGELRAAVRRALGTAVVPILVDRDRTAAEAAVAPPAQPVDPRTAQDLVAEALDEHARRADVAPAGLLRPGAAAWLTAAGPSAALTDAVRAAAEGDADAALGIGPADRACAIEWLRNGRPVAGLAALVQLVLLDDAGSWDAIPAAQRIVGPAQLWEPAELLGIERRFPGALPEEFLVGTIACIGASAPTLPLAIAVAARGTPTEAVRFAVVRAWAEAAAGGTNQPGVDEDVRTVVTEVLGRFPDHAAVDVYGPLLVDAAISLDTADPGPRDWTADELAALRSALRTPELVDAAHRLQTARGDRLDEAAERVAGIAALVLAAAPGASGAPPSAQTELLAEAAGDDGVPLLESLVRDGLERGIVDAASLPRAIAAAAGDGVRGADLERSARSWLRGLAKDAPRRPGRGESRRGARRTDLKES